MFLWQRLAIQSEQEYQQADPNEVKEALSWYNQNFKIQQEKNRFWDKKNLYRTPGLGINFSYGYTPNLDKFCEDLSFPAPFSHQLVGREKEIKLIESVLSKSDQANIILVGEPGVGKHTLILGFAKAIKEQRVNSNLFYKRVLKLNMDLFLGESMTLTKAKEQITLLLNEAEQAGNIILVINHIDKYISTKEGIDLTSALSGILRSHKVNLIGITDPLSFERTIFPNQEFLRYFEKVEVNPPSKEEALEIIKNILLDFEKGKKVVLTLAALKEVINQSDRLITDIPFPEKAIDLIDRLINQAIFEKKKLIKAADVDVLISQKLKVPVGNLSSSEANKLKNLGQAIQKRLVGQKQAVDILVASMQRARLGVSSENKPIGTFLFLGPTGVGKTETAKALAESYFGSEDLIIRIDMNQYQKENAIDTLVGLMQTGRPGILVKEVREKPYSVILLDEFEKASREVHHLFLTVFDEGYLKDINGKTVSFKNTIIICTSNAGAEFIREKVAIGATDFNNEIVEFLLKNGVFSPELINRFDGVICYRPLSTQEIRQIAILMLEKLNKRLSLKQITLIYDEGIIQALIDQGFNPQYGARPMQRVISDKIETLVAKYMLENKIVSGDKLKLLFDSSTKQFTIVKA